MDTLTISQLARRSGVPATTLRYYEKVGVLPAATRSEAGYRQYDQAAVARIAFVQRAKALGIELDDLADLVRLWDGDECAPVQERLRAMVHEQRTATRQRLAELTQLASNLSAVGASIGGGGCGPHCACLQPVPSLSDRSERLMGAACTLDAVELPARLAEWHALRDRATAIEPVDGGARLSFEANEALAPIADLIARESECCSFYTFSLRVDGPTRQLEIGAGPGWDAAVQALLGLDQILTALEESRP